MNALQPVNFAHVPVRDPRISSKYVPGKHSRRFWTAEEDTVIRERYPDGGVAACMPYLPDRDRTKIQHRANTLGVSRNGISTERRRTHTTPELDETIRTEWQALDGRKKGAVQALADRLDIPRSYLTKRAMQLGLVIPHVRKEPNWTSAEDELMRQVPLHDPEKSARIFREHGYPRTASAIVVRAKRLELSRRDTREQLSATKVGKILGIDAKGVTRWIESGDLVATKRADKRTAQQGGSAWDIEPADLRRFVMDKLQFVDFRKVDKFALVDLLVRPPEKAPFGWTEAQDEILRGMWSTGASPDEIGKAVGKTVAAVTTRRFTLGLERRNRRWTEEDANRIRTMFEAGATDEEIAADLGIKATDVGNRRNRMGLRRERVRLTSPVRGDIIRLRAEGFPVRDIAETLGVTGSWVYQILEAEKARAA